ncbi:DUF397 domain-containing protein [Embleya hyalina]|uniref:DUF397 domain-containing protein n=1 Tax=Embleya hyalina TaxID=516124 RepID=UPI001FE4319E|nr:DUF397 domain-containing protein [Embleya hyalina]
MLVNAPWRTSSYTANNTNCVEAAPLSGTVAVRDSKVPGGRPSSSAPPPSNGASRRSRWAPRVCVLGPRVGGPREGDPHDSGGCAAAA